MSATVCVCMSQCVYVHNYVRSCVRARARVCVCVYVCLCVVFLLLLFFGWLVCGEGLWTIHFSDQVKSFTHFLSEADLVCSPEDGSDAKVDTYTLTSHIIRLSSTPVPPAPLPPTLDAPARVITMAAASSVWPPAPLLPDDLQHPIH